MKNQNYSRILAFFLMYIPILAFCQWQSIGSGIENESRTIVGLSVINENVIWAISFNTGTWTGLGEVVKTTDGGLSWDVQEFDSENGFFPVGIFALDENNAWIAGNKFPHSKIFKTSDGGQTWVVQPNAFSIENQIASHIFFFDENVGIAYGFLSGSFPTSFGPILIYRTEDGGNQWTQVFEYPVMENEQIFTYSGNNHFAVVEDNIWFGTNRGRIFKSTNRGQSWVAYETGLKEGEADRAIHSIAFKDELHGIALSTAVWSGPTVPLKIVATQDGGQAWTEIPTPVDQVARLVEYIPDSDGAFILYGGGFSFPANSPDYSISLNNGQNWLTVQDDNIFCMEFISPSIGFAGRMVESATEGGIFKWTGNPLVDTDFIHQEVMLDEVEVFPNPCVSGEPFTFSIRNNLNDLLEVSLVDIYGRTIDSPFTIKKDHAVLDLIAPASKGIYFLTIKAPTGKFETRKFIVR